MPTSVLSGWVCVSQRRVLGIDALLYWLSRLLTKGTKLSLGDVQDGQLFLQAFALFYPEDVPAQAEEGGPTTYELLSGRSLATWFAACL
eukprot:7314538-Pyramimonas_sp.AAC.2